MQLLFKHTIMETLNLTDLENRFLNCLISKLDCEEGYSDVDIHDITDSLNIDEKILRGVQSSLIKKGIISSEDNGEGFVIIYLNEDFYHLHPDWC